MQDDAPPKKIVFGKVDGRRKQGSPRLRWLVVVEEEMVSRNIINNWKKLASDRTICRKALDRFDEK